MAAGISGYFPESYDAQNFSADIATTELNILDNVKPELTQKTADAENLIQKDADTLTTNSTKFESEITKTETQDTASLTLGTSDREELRYFNRNSQNVEGKYSDNKILYEDIWPHTDLLVTLLENGVKEDIILKNNQAPTTFEYLVETVGLRLELTSDGGFEFLDRFGNKKFYTPAPDLTDATGKKITTGIFYKLEWERKVESENLKVESEEDSIQQSVDSIQDEEITVDSSQPTVSSDTAVEETVVEETLETVSPVAEETPTVETSETPEIETTSIVEDVESSVVRATAPETKTPETSTETPTVEIPADDSEATADEPTTDIPTEETSETETSEPTIEETPTEPAPEEASPEPEVVEEVEEAEPVAFFSKLLPKFFRASLLDSSTSSEQARESFENSEQNYEQIRQDDGSILRRYKLALVISSTENLTFPLDLDPSTFVQTVDEAAEQAAEEVADPTAAITTIGRNLTTNNLTVRGTLTTSGTNLSIDSGLLYLDSANDRVGIGTTVPAATLDADGSIILNKSGLSTADFVFGSPQLAGDGNEDHDYRMWFDKSKGAFRVGYVTSNQWDDANVGYSSFASGRNTIASGHYSTAMGYDTTADELYSTAMGRNTIASGQSSTAIGNFTTASGGYSTAMGWNTTASGDRSTAIGNSTIASGNYTTTVGFAIAAQGDYSFGIGLDSTARTITAANTMAIMGGNVGIGTTAPGAKLEVAGRISQTETGLSVFLGEGAGANDDLSDNKNAFIGYRAGYSNTNGDFNAFIGYQAGYSNTSGYYNTFIGRDAGYFNNGNSNTFIGTETGSANTSGADNTFMGRSAGLDNTTGRDNTCLGAYAGESNISGDGNTFVGNGAGYSNTGSGNVFLGTYAGRNETGSNKLFIDNSTTANPLIYGEFDNDILVINGSVGIGVTDPDAKLEVNGGIKSGFYTADPCGTLVEGTIWYNDTADCFCFCDGAGVDKKVSDNSGCF